MHKKLLTLTYQPEHIMVNISNKIFVINLDNSICTAAARTSAEAESAYRDAIAGGVTEASLDWAGRCPRSPGAERDEEAAYRAAMASDDLATAAWAAAYLGEMLDIIYDDRSAARACFEFVEKYGSRTASFKASARLAEFLAYDGEIEAARDRVRSYAIAVGDERNQDMSGKGAESIALLVSGLAGGRYHPERVASVPNASTFAPIDDGAR